MPQSPLTCQFLKKPAFRVWCLYSSFVRVCVCGGERCEVTQDYFVLLRWELLIILHPIFLCVLSTWVVRSGCINLKKTKRWCRLCLNRSYKKKSQVATCQCLLKNGQHSSFDCKHFFGHRQIRCTRICVTSVMSLMCPPTIDIVIKD
jgi:hypothetical protein